MPLLLNALYYLSSEELFQVLQASHSRILQRKQARDAKPFLLPEIAQFGCRMEADDLQEMLQRRVKRISSRTRTKGEIDPNLRKIALAQTQDRVNYARIDDPDAAAADLHFRFPWMREANIAFMRAARMPGPFHMQPIILTGKPGCGKSSWAVAVSQALGQKPIRVDLSATSGGHFALTGTDKGWSASQPGEVVRGLAMTCRRNTLIIVDEVDLGTGNVTAGNSSRSFPGPVNHLLSLLEPLSAGAWKCPSTGAIFDLRDMCWIMTTNHPGALPQALLDRCLLIEVAQPSHEQIREAGYRAGEDIEAGLGAMIEAIIDERARRGHPLRSLRSLQKILETAQVMLDRPMHH